MNMSWKARAATCALVIAGVVFGLRMYNRQAVQERAVPGAQSQRTPQPAERVPSPTMPPADAGVDEVTPPPPNAGPSKPAAGSDRATTAKPQTQRAPSSPAGSAKEPIRDPVAREALSPGGVDPYAEKSWAEAINDPALPAQERQAP